MMKNIKLSISLIGLLTLSCSPSTEEENKAIATKMFLAFNAHDWQKVASYYSQDADFLDSSYGTAYVKKSHKDIVDEYYDIVKMFPDISDEITGMYATGDKVIVEFISEGSSGDSIKFKLPICSILTLQNGKILHDATYYDN
jgi:ketosteroid isomerase-like protein